MVFVCNICGIFLFLSYYCYESEESLINIIPFFIVIFFSSMFVNLTILTKRNDEYKFALDEKYIDKNSRKKTYQNLKVLLFYFMLWYQ